LGLGFPNSDRPIPTPLPSLVYGADQIEGNEVLTLFLCNKNVFATGDNADVGLGSPSRSLGVDGVYTPIQVTALYAITDISVANDGSFNSHCVATTEFGVAYTWGYDAVSQTSPKLVANLKNISNAFENKYGGIFVNAKGETFSSGTQGNHGLGDSYSYYAPELVRGIMDPKESQRSFNELGTLLLARNGTLYGSGLNAYGQLGIVWPSYGFTRVNIQNVTQISLCEYVGAALSGNGSLFLFGDNYYGSMGLNFTSTTPTYVPSLVPTLSNYFIMEVRVGNNHVLVRTNTWEIFSWGLNSNGQVGINSLVDVWSPRKVTSLSNITGIAAMGQNSFAVDMYGNLYVWGLNPLCGMGVFGGDFIVPILNTQINQVESITTSRAMILAKTTTGSYYTWGLNSGQLGLGTGPIAYVVMPTKLPPVKNLIKYVPSATTMLYINSCNNSWAGTQCDIPVCFGEARGSELQCSREGICISPNVCQCFPPTTGVNCELSEYHWRGDRSGNANTSGSWVISRNGVPFTSPAVPTFLGDSIVIDQPGTYSVIFVIPPGARLQYLKIGGPGVFARVSLSSNDLTILTNIMVFSGSNVVFSDLQLSVGGNVLLSENTTLSNVNFTFQTINVTSGTTTFKNGVLDGFIGISGSATVRMDTLTSATGISVENSGSLVFVEKSTLISPSIQLNNYNNILVQSGANLMVADLVLNNFQLGVVTIKGIVSSTTQSSKITNYGIMNLDSSTQPIQFSAPMDNYGVMSVYGNLTTTMARLSSNPGSVLQLLQSYLILQGQVNISGALSASGTIECSNLTYSSVDPLRLSGPSYSLKVIGNMEIISSSTIFFQIRGLVYQNNDFLNVTGQFTHSGLTLVKKSGSYLPEVGQTVQFISYGSLIANMNNVALLGTPYKNVMILSNDNSAFFNIIYSFGSVSSTGYRCHYMGKKKILEITEFPNQNLIAMAVTVP
jgi:alpha-tubulin suppressor-like RCC1 family protein